MKAWLVHDGQPHEAALLVFAPTATRAKVLGFRFAPWMVDEYIYMRARRAPEWDRYALVLCENGHRELLDSE